MNEPSPMEAVPSESQPIEPVKSVRSISKETLSRVISLLLVVIITVVIFIFAPQIQRFQEYGYPGVFVVSLVGNATIFLPMPSLAVIFAMGGALYWPLVGLVGGIGEALGETTGYLAGYSGSAIIEDRDVYTKIQGWMEKHGFITLFVLSAIPNPVIDLAGISAGALKYGYLKFLLACWLGKTLKAMAFAWGGAQSIAFFQWFLG